MSKALQGGLRPICRFMRLTHGDFFTWRLRYGLQAGVFRSSPVRLLMMASHELQGGSDIFERILEAPVGLVALEGGVANTLIGQFRTISRHSGQAVYGWAPGTGLCSLRDDQAQVPDCQRLGNALRYMLQSMHFGIYLLSALELPLSAMDAALLRQLSQVPKERLRRVVLLDPTPSLIESLGDTAFVISAHVDAAVRPRLRDGHWIV